jgi:thymidylate kinase
LVIYLDVDTETSARLLKNKGERDYLKDTKDIHEEDRDYQAKVLKMYKILAQNTEHWRKISCTIDSRLRSIDDIHKAVLEILISEKFI